MNTTHIIACCFGILLFPVYEICDAQDVTEIFRQELTKVVLGVPDALPLGESEGHMLVALAAPGSAWSLQLADEPLNLDAPVGTSSLAEQFDYPAIVMGGVLNFRRTERLEDLWRRLLAHSVPDEMNNSGIRRSILFKQPDKIDEARGLTNELIKSPEFLRYEEYSEAWNVLSSANNEDGTWRLHPRFSGYSSLSSARERLREDWVLFGYRLEVEGALRELRERVPEIWHRWLAANQAFEDHTLALVPDVPIGRSYFFPSDSEWEDMRSWSNASFQTSGGDSISCQVASVEIRRPWLDVSLIGHPEFKLRQSSRLGLVSDGKINDGRDLAQGRIANIVSKLILVRRIRGAREDDTHPLARFVSPSSINLLGFVVLSLPPVSAE